MKIRPAKKSDFPAILEIYSKSKLDELKNESLIFELLPLDQDKARLSELNRSNVYVFEDNDVIAYGGFSEQEITALFVHPQRRGKGIGKQLLTFLLSKIEGEASLYVAKTNTSAKRLYQTLGFAIVDEFETSYNGIPVLANKMILASSTDKS